jgi:hypothetical protein
MKVKRKNLLKFVKCVNSEKGEKQSKNVSEQLLEL